MLANNLSGNVDYSDSEERMRIERILLGQEVMFEKMHEEDVGKMEEIHEEDVRKFEKLDRDLYCRDAISFTLFSSCSREF